MNRFFLVFICGMLMTLVTQILQSAPTHEFETVHTISYHDVNAQEVSPYFTGYQWLENKLSSEVIDLNKVYQEKAFSKKLVNESKVKRVQKSYTTYVEEKICPQSPYIDQPVRGSLSSHFGRRIHPLSGRRHLHAGLDFRGQIGTPVLAASTGIVKMVDRKGAYGKTVIIDHGNSFTTLYGHLNDYAVEDGQWVNLGQTIGYIGKTGRATGPHLHFEVRCHNVPLNPRQYLGKMGKTAEVKFHRRLKHISRQPASYVGQESKPVNHDPNYYTRMINLQKLQGMTDSAQKF